MIIYIIIIIIIIIIIHSSPCFQSSVRGCEKLSLHFKVIAFIFCIIFDATVEHRSDKSITT